MAKQTDLDFLREMKTRLADGWDRSDPTQIQMVQQMIDDWIGELEEEIKGGGVNDTSIS